MSDLNWRRVDAETGHAEKLSAEQVEMIELRKINAQMLAALEAGAKYTAYIRAVSDATPEGEMIPASDAAHARYLGDKAERLRNSAIAMAKGETDA